MRVCTDLPCVAAGAQGLLQKLPPLLGRAASVQPSACLGRCDQAAAVLVGERPVPCATAQRVADCVKEGETTHDPEGYIGLSQYRAAAGYAMLDQCLRGERDADSVLAALAAARLPAARQWRQARAEAVPRVLVVQLDDFRGRVHLERDPHRFIEGLLIAAWACGSTSAIAHLHPAWHGCHALLQQELARLQAAPPAAGLPRMELQRQDANPAATPPGQPVLAQDFGTLFRLRGLLEHGPEWFAAQGGSFREDFRAFAN